MIKRDSLNNPRDWAALFFCYSYFFSETFGQEAIDVEEGKKENRSLATFRFNLQDFISRYKNEDIYMVESLPVKMRGTVHLEYMY